MCGLEHFLVLIVHRGTCHAPFFKCHSKMPPFCFLGEERAGSVQNTCIFWKLIISNIEIRAERFANTQRTEDKLNLFLIRILILSRRQFDSVTTYANGERSEAEGVIISDNVLFFCLFIGLSPYHTRHSRYNGGALQRWCVTTVVGS